MSFKSPTASSAAELPRDRWGRPLITPPSGGEPRAYTRVTTFAKVLDDTYHLTQWQIRMAVLGMAKRPDLVLSATAVSDPDNPSQKRLLNEIGASAKDAAAPSAARIGTALHSFTEKVDRGEPLTGLPPIYAADLEAYDRVKKEAGLEVHSIEGFVVDDRFEVGGTYDRVYTLTKDLPIPPRVLASDRYDIDHIRVADDGTAWLTAGTHIVGDVKTGKSVELGALSFGVQLGCYANGLPYDHTTGTRTAHPTPISRALAVVMHVPAGRGEATLYWLDIATGYRAAAVAEDVRLARTAGKSMIAPGLTTTAPPALTIPEEIASATSDRQLTAIWKRNKDAWTPGLSALAKARSQELTAS